MRTTVDLDDVVLSAARAKARAEHISLGKAVSDLALAGLMTPPHVESPDPGGPPVLRGVPGRIVTDELVHAHRDDD